MMKGFLFTVAICAWLSCNSIAVGQGGGMGGGMGGGGKGHGGMGSSAGSDRRNAPSDYYRGAAPPPTQIILTPHGGEYLLTETNHYEIVYMPLQTRIYVFDSKMKPLSARDVHAQMSLKVSAENTPQWIPFQYVGMPAGSAEQDYVVAVFDNRQLTDEDTPIALEFSGLPNQHKATSPFTSLFKSGPGDKTTISFNPTFSPSKIRPYVARVLLTEADRDGVMRQRMCPVSGQMLGSRGPITKVYIADHPLYLSGEDCIAAVKDAPEKYLPQPVTPMPAR